jgi:hypothetical protein
MKTLKRISFLAIAALFFAPTFQSCKKGEEDPGLSLRSRTARLAGEWTVTEMNQTATSENTNSSSGGSLSSGTSVEDYSFDGTALTIYSTNTSVNSGLTNTYKDTMVYDAVSMTYTIEKDGTFKSTNDMMATETNTYSWGTVTYTEEMVEEVSGTWDFNSGVGEEGSKERVYFYYNSGTRTTTSTTTVTYTDGSPTETDVDTEVFTYSYSNVPEDTWLLTKLANKEIIVDLSTNYSGSTVTTTNPSGGSSYSNTSTSSYTASGSFTATQE